MCLRDTSSSKISESLSSSCILLLTTAFQAPSLIDLSFDSKYLLISGRVYSLPSNSTVIAPFIVCDSVTNLVCSTPKGIFSFLKISISFFIDLIIKSYLAGRLPTASCSTNLRFSESENSESLGLIFSTKSRKEDLFSSLSVSQVIAMYSRAPFSEICSDSSDASLIIPSIHFEHEIFLFSNSST